MKMISFNTFSLLSLIALVCLATGCNGNVKVSGTVKLEDGTPIQSGRVIFEQDTFSAVGAIENGKYQMGTLKENDGLPRGEYIVYINGAMKPGEQFEVANGINSETGQANMVQMTTFSPLVAKEYTEVQSSPLRCKVEKSMTFDIVVPASE
ncbi:MAG: hypothetical protein Q4C95_08595 [Planctomycetia bacterium]|nr:hypothetical protein [Planctomycetia bacterium]